MKELNVTVIYEDPRADAHNAVFEDYPFSLSSGKDKQGKKNPVNPANPV